MKKLIFIFSSILFFLGTTSVYSISLFGSKLDGMWIPNMKLSMEYENMQKHEPAKLSMKKKVRPLKLVLQSSSVPHLP